MKTTLFTLILCILFFHAAATVGYCCGKVSYQQTIVSAEEEEESSHAQQSSCHPLPNLNPVACLAEISAGKKFSYAHLAGTLAIPDRIEMPPEA